MAHCKSCENARNQALRATPEGKAKNRTASVKSKAKPVISPRTGKLIRAGSAYNMKHFSQSDWHELKLQISQETNRLLKQLAQGKGHNDAPYQKLLGADREACLKHFNKQLAARGWTWDNYLGGGIEIDHRVPLSAAHSDTELRTLALLPNVQLLTKAENAIKAIKDKVHSA